MIELSYETANTSPFCRTKLLTGGAEFRIEQNDLIGACLYEEDYEPLELVSDTDENSRLVYFSEDSSYDQCSDSSFKNIDISQNFNINREWILHLNVQISKFHCSVNVSSLICTGSSTTHNIVTGLSLKTIH